MQRYLEYDKAVEALQLGSDERLEELAGEIADFPMGVDSFIHRRWIINAIDMGSVGSIAWMLSKGIDLNFRDDDGYTALHSALERSVADRHHVLRLLLAAGAPVNRNGIHGYTPAHFAAAKGDVEALRLLIDHGADLSIRTEIDKYATPLEVARFRGRNDVVQFLESIA